MSSDTKADEAPTSTDAESKPEADEEEEDEEADEPEKQDKSKKSKKQTIEYEARLQREEAVAYFEALVGGLRSGHLEFRQGDRVLILNPVDQLEIEVSAEVKGEKCKVEFEISWRAGNRPMAILDAPPEQD